MFKPKKKIIITYSKESAWKNISRYALEEQYKLQVGKALIAQSDEEFTIVTSGEYCEPSSFNFFTNNDVVTTNDVVLVSLSF